jgi:hypothetical protein
MDYLVYWVGGQEILKMDAFADFELNLGSKLGIHAESDI